MSNPFEHLDRYKETVLPGGYTIGRGGRQTGHCEDYTELLFKDGEFVLMISPIDRESKTLGDILASFRREIDLRKTAIEYYENLLSELSVGDPTQQLGSRY